MKIATGQSEDHPTPLPLNESASPGLATPTPAFPSSATEQGGVRDTTGERLSQLASSEAEWAAAQTAGMDARNAMLAHYGADILPQGAAYGDLMNIPPVPDNALPAANSYGYPYPGQEPVPAASGFEDPSYGT